MCLPVKVLRPECVIAEGSHAGFEWAIVHNGMGFRCGYVKVEPGHPWHGQHYDNIDASVHGGLTFGEHDTPCDNGGPDNGYWVGFDCAHSGDGPDPSLPGCRPSMLAGFRGSIKTTEFVKSECHDLCEQAAAAVK